MVKLKMIKLYNFLSRKKEFFRPLYDKRVGLYTCGPTVYNYAHIGNLRTYIFEDVLRRALEYNGYKVKQVMNITDIEDKIINGAKRAGKPIYEFTELYEKAFFADLKKLNIEPAFKYPKATANIPEMIKIISSLLKKGLAYKSGGSVYFDISKFKNYGKLSGLKLEKLKIGARVDADEYNKENAKDFVLWKKAKAGDPRWQAPFGKGRPGWHIECSTMSIRYLGPTIDIHAGAVDLIFPHHENEIAESEGAFGKKFVNYFIEGEHLLVGGEKMSKSLKNVFTLRDIENRGFDPFAFRYLTLTAHYRSKLNFTWESLGAAQNAFNKLKELITAIKKEVEKSTLSKTNFEKYRKELLSYINDDLEMPRALALLWKVVKSNAISNKIKYALIADFDKVLGLNLADVKTKKIPAQILKLLKTREKYRKEKNFKKSDKIRKKIELLGWVVEDTSKKPKLKRKQKN